MQKSTPSFLFLMGMVGALLRCTDLSTAGTSANHSSFPKPEIDQPVAIAKGQEVAVVSGRCLWGIQAIYQHMRGVIAATSGYSGGDAENAHYESVGNGRTGHAETVRIVYDPRQITYGQILMIFFAVAHNPTEF